MSNTPQSRAAVSSYQRDPLDSAAKATYWFVLALLLLTCAGAAMGVIFASPWGGDITIP